MAIVGVALILAGCGGATPEAPQSPTAKKADISNIQIEGDRDLPVNQLAMEAIADLQQYWTERFPNLYGEEYTPLEGGLWALTSESEAGPECASGYGDVAGNAFYCKLDDSIAWDTEALLPQLQATYGDFAIPVVLAHEWGHAMQQRSGMFDESELTVTTELQADCFAGAWSRHAQDDGVFDVDSAELDTSLAAILSYGDSPGQSTQDPSAHGSGFDRVGAFQDGYDNGLERCAEYRDGEPLPIDLPWNDVADAASGGNAPYESIVNGVPYDLEDFWSFVYPQLTEGEPWQPVRGLEAFDPSDPPMCGNESTEDFALFYCVPDDFVGWDNVEFMPGIYDEAGDYAVSTLLSTQYALAALHRLGDESDERTSTLRADCLTGSYTSSVILGDRRETSSWSISPGDLDEGIKALLVFRGPSDAERQGAGFDRVRAFREGVLYGAQRCLSYEP